MERLEDLLQRVRRRNSCVPVLVLTAKDAVQGEGQDYLISAQTTTSPNLLRLPSCWCVWKALLRRGPVNRHHAHASVDLELDRLTQQ